MDTQKPEAVESPFNQAVCSSQDVARILRATAENWKREAGRIDYKVANKIRHAIDVHIDLLTDLADELENPGSTKYAMNYSWK